MPAPARLDPAGTDTDIGVLLEYTGDNGLVLGAHIGCRPRSDPDAHATYFTGTFAENGGGWQLDAEMIAGDPVRFGDLLHLLGADGAPQRPDVCPTRP
ncbi:hypothetical protein OG948_41580 (plasmid) [Embleya sp. NBC_00888]|uniref:hypothetical protein n=1 Tax=Embleya sp. NBC_00888 TaxID=2975960 RepID=UPI002F907B8F|nr:hypothetical protein OG948_41580 [Embleya sp. NBC_00888]